MAATTGCRRRPRWWWWPSERAWLVGGGGGQASGITCTILTSINSDHESVS
jgi:hypothetical protein